MMRTQPKRAIKGYIRLIHYGGVLKDIKRELKLKDGEDDGSDLVNESDRPN